MQGGARRDAPRVVTAIAAFAGLLLVASLFLLNNDAWLRALIENQVAARTGRTLQIAGGFEVDWSLTPRIRAEKVTLDNAPWGSHPTMLEVERLDCNVSLFDLLLGDLVLPEVALSRPWVLLEFNSEGERNWILERRQKRTDNPPRIVRLTIDSGKLRYRNPTANTDVTLNLATVESAPEQARTKFAASGVFRGLKASAQGTGGAVLSLRDETLPYPLNVKLGIGATHASANGEVAGLVTLARVKLDIKLEGPGLRELGKIIRIPLPESLPYWVAGNLSRNRDSWGFIAFKGALGKSDLAGEFAFDRQGERPFIHANITSKQLVTDDLPLKTKDDSRPAELKRLRDFDADVKLDAKSVRIKERVVGDLSARLKLAAGELQFDPLKFQLGGGRINATALIDARTEPPQMNVGMTMSELQLEKLFRKTRGTAAGSANVVSSGSSFPDMVANSNGEVRFVVSEGEISSLLVSYMGLDAAGLFSSLIGDSNVPVNCAIGDFALKSGVLHTQALVIDTTKSDIAGSGTINLAKRTWDLTFSPLMEKGILSGLISDGAPVHVGGTFKNPEFSADTSGVAVRAGAAVALGIINPLAALIPLLPSAADKEANCAQLVEATQARGMSPKN